MRHYKLPRARSIKGQRGLSVEVCGNVLLRTTADIGMRGATGEELDRHPLCHGVTTSGMGRSGWLGVVGLMNFLPEMLTRSICAVE